MLFFLIGAVLCAWAILRLLGSQHHNDLHLMHARISRERAVLDEVRQAAETAKKHSR